MSVEKITVDIVNKELGTNFEGLNWNKFRECNDITEDFLTKYISVLYSQLKSYPVFMSTVLMNKNIKLSDEFIYSTFKYGYLQSSKYYVHGQFHLDRNFSEEFIERWINEYPKQYWYFDDVIRYQKLSEEFIRKHIDIIEKCNFWGLLSKYQKLSMDFIEEYVDKLDLYEICFYQKLSINFIEKYYNFFVNNKKLDYIYAITYAQNLDILFIDHHFDDLITKVESYGSNDNLLFKHQHRNIPVSYIEEHWDILKNKDDVLDILFDYYKFPQKFLQDHLNDFDLKWHSKRLRDLLEDQKLSLDFLEYLGEQGYLDGKDYLHDNRFWDTALNQKVADLEFIKKHINKFNWKNIAYNGHLSEKFIETYFDKLKKHSYYLFKNSKRKFSIELLDKIGPKMDKKSWEEFLDHNKATILPEWFIEKYADAFPWDSMLCRKEITTELIKKYRHHINAHDLFKSKKFKDYVELCDPDEIKSMLLDSVKYIRY